jgi:hypothetical protein
MVKKTQTQVNKEADKTLEAARLAFTVDMKALEAKHGMKIIPMLEYHAQGLYPTLGLQETPKEEKKGKKGVV